MVRQAHHKFWEIWITRSARQIRHRRRCKQKLWATRKCEARKCCPEFLLNHRMAGRRLSFQFNFPWALLGGTIWLPRPLATCHLGMSVGLDSNNLGGNTGGSFSPHPAASAAGNFSKTRYSYNMWTIWSRTRTYFKEKYSCAGVSIPSSAQKTAPELEAEEVNPPKRTIRKL